MNTSFFHDMLGSIAERAGRCSSARPAGRGAGRRAKAPETLESLSRALLSGRGEASGVALARQLLDRYAGEPMPARIEFFRLLAQRLRPGPGAIGRAWDDYRQDASPANLQRLLEAVEPPRQELFRRLNLAPGGTAALVADARGPDQARRQGAGPAQGRRRLRAPVRLLVQSRLPGAAPDRLVDAGRHPRADHPLRGGARDPRLGRPAPPRPALRPPLLRLLPSIAGRRAADLRRGGADPGDPRLDPGTARRGARSPAGRRGDDGRVLLDQQLPARPARRVVRQLPDQAGGRGAVARAAVAHDLRHPLAGTRVRGLAREARTPAPAARHPAGTRTPQRRSSARAELLPLAASYFLTPRARAASRSIRWPASTSATAPGSSASTGLAIPRPRACARRMA